MSLYEKKKKKPLYFLNFCEGGHQSREFYRIWLNNNEMLTGQTFIYIYRCFEEEERM